MKDQNSIIFSYQQNLTFLHLLTKSNPFIQFKSTTLYPLTFSMEFTLYLLLNLIQSHKVQPIVKRIVEYQLLTPNFPRRSLDISLSPRDSRTSGILMFPIINSLPKDISIQFCMVNREHINCINSRNSQKTTIPVCSISLKIVSEQSRYFHNSSNNKFQISNYIMGHFYSQSGKETLFYSTNHQFMTHIGQYHQTFVSLGYHQQFKICYPFGSKTFQHFDQPQLHRIDLQPQILESYQQMRRTKGKSCYSFQVEHRIPNQKTIAAFTHHTVHVFEARHALDTAAVELCLDFAVYILWEIILNELDTFQEGATKREDVRLGGGDIEVGFGHWGLRDRLEQHPLECHLGPLFDLWSHPLVINNCNSTTILNMRPIEVRLVGRFRFTQKIQGQHDHLLYQGMHTQTSESVFMKGEQYKIRPNDQVLTILQQGKILQIMQGGTGIPHMHWCGQQEDYNFIVLEELDRSLKQLMGLCGGKFKEKTMLMLGQEVIAILQYFHFKNFIHNQLQPSNFMLGTGQKQGRFFIVDYGAASRYKDAQTFQHIPEVQRPEPRYINLQFSSLRYNRGQGISRRDDLESLIYLMLFWVKGSLPWSQMSHNTKKSDLQKARAVAKMKQQIPQQQLFEGHSQLLQLFRYTRTLQFDQKPRYVYYKTVMRQKIQKLGYSDDKIYDWMLLDEPEPFDNLQLNFQVIPNQAQFLKQIRQQLKGRQQAEQIKQKQKQKRKQLTMKEVKSPRNKDKECQIY